MSTETTITVRVGEKSEELAVHDVRDHVHKYDDGGPHDVGEEFWVIEGIDPSETDLIPSDLVWLSGSLGEPMSDEKRKKFPLVYVPKEGDVAIDE